MKKVIGILSVMIFLGLVLCGCSKTESEKTSNTNQLSLKGSSLNNTNTLVGMDERLIPDGSLLLNTLFYDDTHLLVMTQNEEHTIILKIYDLVSGTTKSGCMIHDASELTWDCFVTKDKKVILQSQDGRVFYCLNKDFKMEYSSRQLPYDCESVLVSKDGENTYFVKRKNPTLYRLTLKSNTVTPIMRLNKADKMTMKMGEIAEDNSFLTIQYENDGGRFGQILISLKEDKAAYYEDEYESIHITGQTLQYSSEQMRQSGMVSTCKLSRQQLKTDLTFDHQEEGKCYQFSNDGEHVITIQSNGGNAEFSYYEIKHGYVTKKTRLDQKKYLEYSKKEKTNAESEKTGISFLGGRGISFGKDAKIACINYWDNGTKHCMLWNIDGEDKTKNKQEELHLFDKSQMQYENEKIIQEIEENYHFKVVARDEAVRYFKEFAVVSLEDEEQLHSALIHIQNVLKKLPEELFSSFSYGSVKGMELYLCKKIITPFSYQVSNASGFADIIDGKQVMVLACNNLSEIETCFAHEFMHGLERVIDYKVIHKKLGNGVLEYWKSLSPNGSYCYQYVTKNGKDIDTSNMGKYTPYDLSEKNSFKNVYFVDPYSRTYPAEDRARIFETLVTSDENLPVYFKSHHLRKKAVYLGKLIRMAFPELKKGKYYWEKWDLN